MLGSGVGLELVSVRVRVMFRDKIRVKVWLSNRVRFRVRFNDRIKDKFRVALGLVSD